MRKAQKYERPVGLLEYMERYGTEEQCRNDLFQKRFKNGFVCPKCEATRGYEISTRHSMKCAVCGYQVSVTAGTVFHETKVPLKKWYLAVYLIAIDKRGISAMGLMREISVTYKTAWYMNKRIRAAMKASDEKYKLDGDVVIDESYFAGVEDSEQVPKKRGRGTNKSKVIVALSADEQGNPKYLKMSLVADFRAKTIAEFAEKNIEKGAKIKTDGFAAYKSQKLLKDYFHEFKNFDKSDENSALKWIHKVIANAKTFIAGTPHGVPGSNSLQEFLDEYCYRFNRRHILQLVPDKLIMSMLVTEPLLYYSDDTESHSF